MTKRWVLPFVFSLSLSLVLSAQGDPEPTTKLASVRAQLAKLHELGSKARLEAGRYRRKCKVVAAEPLFLYLRSALKAVEPSVEKMPKRAAIKEMVASFGKEVNGFIALGESAIPAVDSASPKGDFDRHFLKQLRMRLVCYEALEEIHRYIVDNREQGSFDGMFDSMKRFGELAPEAFLEIFSYLDHDSTVRRIAGEGVAQLGKHGDAELLKSVRGILEDEYSKPEIKDKASWILARLGDQKVIDEKLSIIEKSIKELSPKLDEINKQREKVIARYKEAEAKAKKSEEGKAELEKVREALGTVTNDALRTAWGLGRAYDRRGWTYMQLRMHEKAEPSYKASLQFFVPVAAQVGQPELRSQVGSAFYNLACSQACQKNLKEALKNIEEAFKWGANTKWARIDGDLRNLWGKKEFKTLVDEVDSGERMKKWREQAEKARKAQKAAPPAEGKKPGSGDAAPPKGKTNPPAKGDAAQPAKG